MNPHAPGPEPEDRLSPNPAARPSKPSDLPGPAGLPRPEPLGRKTRSPARPPVPARLASWRNRLAARFLQYPLIHFALTNTRWSIAVLLLFVLGALGGLSLLKVWQVTPSGFRPLVRVSALDLIQAQRLASSARRFAAQGRVIESATAWQNAAANNPGNPMLLRNGLGQTLASRDLTAAGATRTLAQAAWLLRLTQTNAADVSLACRVFARYGRWAQIYDLLEHRREIWTPAETEAFLKAALHTGHIAEFREVGSRSQPLFRANPELGLYEAAYMAGWAPADHTADGWNRLREAAQDPKRRLLAHQMYLMLHADRRDVPAYAAALEILETAHADRLADHWQYWRLLDATGQTAQARELALGASNRRVLPWEVVDMAQVYLDLGLRSEAAAFLKANAERYGDSTAPWSPAIWVLTGNLLADLRRWDEVRWTAARIRALDHAYAELAGFAHYLEGRAHQAQGYEALARAAFEKAASRSFPFPETGLAAAVTLIRLRYYDLAQTLLEAIEPGLGTDPRYWQALFEAVHAQRQDPVLLFKAAMHAHQLAPEEAACRHNYAAALLVNRWNPVLAVSLTRAILDELPHSTAARLNHGLALVLNRRYDDAEELLRPVNPATLSAPERTTFHLAALEINAHHGRLVEARQALEGLDARELYPNQRQWLAEFRSTLASH